jgi:RND family efflux transporter MFP subunit
VAVLGVAIWQGALFYSSALAAKQKPRPVPTAIAKRGELPLTLAGYGTLEASNTFTLRNRGAEASASAGALDPSGSGRERGRGGGAAIATAEVTAVAGAGGAGAEAALAGAGGGGRGPGGGGEGGRGGPRGGGPGGPGGGGRGGGGGGFTGGGGFGGGGGFTGGGGFAGGFGGRGGGGGRGEGIQGVESQIVDIVEDGVLVTKGQIVVRLDKTRFERQLRDRKLAYENALATVKRVEADTELNVSNIATRMKKAEMDQSLLLSSSRAEIDQAQAEVKYNASELEYRQRTFERTDRLAKDRLVPATDVEQADLTVKRSEFQVKSGERQLESTQHRQRSAVSQGELAISDAKYTATSAENKARTTVENARYNAESARYLYELSQKQLEWCELRAPVTGLVVLRREWDRSGGTPRVLQPGDPVRPNQPLMQIIDLSRMRVTVDMGEMDASQIQVGQPVRVWPRSAPKEVFKGKVLSISKLARQGDTWRRGAIPGKKTFRVVVEVLESRPELLRPGLTADFEILQGKVADTVRVPLQGLFKTSKGTSVFVKKGERFLARPVKLGPRNANFAAVVSGLNEGEEIAVQRPPLELLGEVAEPKQQANLLSRMLGMIWKS